MRKGQSWHLQVFHLQGTQKLKRQPPNEVVYQVREYDSKVDGGIFLFFVCKKIIKNDFHSSIYDFVNNIKNKKRLQHPHESRSGAMGGGKLGENTIIAQVGHFGDFLV